MPTEQSESFADNWAYLKMELRWLDQVLMVAVARQRKEKQEIDRISHARVDRATSPWWKGIISTEGKALYDEHRQPSNGTKTTYQQQLESKIQVSYSQGVQLALPRLRDRLGLTVFEKNLVLMSLAPEINRRYARLYRYLQGEEFTPQTDLPTLDLALRLLCRNDVEWREARHRLLTASPLVQHQLLRLSSHLSDSLLNCPLKLSEPLVNYLLSGQPTEAELNTLLSVLPSSAPQKINQPLGFTQTSIAVSWSDLVLPAPLLSALQGLSQRLQGQAEAQARWGIAEDQIRGSVALLTGTAGTGKTTAAAAIAYSLSTALYCCDLALVDPQDYPQVLQEIATQAPVVLLLKSAECWFGRSSLLPAHQLHQFWTQRQQVAGITLLSVRQTTAMQLQWRRRADQILEFLSPTLTDRLQLWQKAFPPQVPLSTDLDWDALAKLSLSGGEIQTIAQNAIFLAAGTAAQVEMQHLVEALAQQNKTLKRTAVPPRHSLTAAAQPTKSTSSRTKRAKVVEPSPTPKNISAKPKQRKRAS